MLNRNIPIRKGSIIGGKIGNLNVHINLKVTREDQRESSATRKT